MTIAGVPGHDLVSHGGRITLGENCYSRSL